VLRRFDPRSGVPELPSKPPSLLAAVPRQLEAFVELARLARARARLAAAPRGDGGPVLVFPGMGVGDVSTRAIRHTLRRLGHDARPWRLGRNRPDVAAFLERLLPRLEALAAARRRRVALVGWSLGGILARELARLRPDLVHRVVTLGSPVVGGFRHTAVAGLFRIQGWNLAEVERLVAEANRTPIRVPVTALWSRRDGIVAWQACVDVATPDVENLEAGSCHWGLGFDPDVLDVIAARLAPAPSPLC